MYNSRCGRRGQRVQAAFGAPGQVAAQVGFGVIAGGTLESGQVGSHRQPQLISERHQTIGRDGQQFGEVHHAQTLSPLPSPAKPMKPVKRGMTGRVGTLRRWMFMQAGRPDHRSKRGPPTRGGVLSGRANTRRSAFRSWPEKHARIAPRTGCSGTSRRTAAPSPALRPRGRKHSTTCLPAIACRVTYWRRGRPADARPPPPSR